MKFLKDVVKTLDKLENVTTDFGPPKIWASTGNYAINKIFTGSYNYGIPFGRLTLLAGPSGSGKSFLADNVLRQAQEEGSFLLVLDSENAQDKNFMEGIGIDTSPDKLMYAGVSTVQDVTKILSNFISGYKKEYGNDNPDAPKVVILLDSIGMLLTEAESDKFNKGVQTGDQGQKAKTVKHMLKTLVNQISRLNIAFVATDQVYPADPMLGDGLWAVTNGVKYAASQIFLITKLKLKDEQDAKRIAGIRMRVEVYKSRFSKLGTKIEIEVPYSSGMSPYTGLLEQLDEDGIVSKAGAWYTFVCPTTGEETKFQRKQMDEELVAKLFTHPAIAEAEEVAVELIEGAGDVNADVE